MSLDRTALAKLQEVVGGDPADVAELIESFLDEAPELLAAIRQSHAAGDVAALKRASHSLKSAAREFGATALTAACDRIEQRCREGRNDGIEAEVGAVDGLFEACAGELRACLAEITG
jgi:HPt (histidine-containing phosphotransfer) domain-containing protein